LTRVLIPNGAIGLGFDEAALWRGVDMSPDVICVDGGSTDSGPHYLGTGTSKYSRASTMAEWRILMQARAKAGVPLIVGTAGTCGTDNTVDWMYQITCDLAVEMGQSVKIARLYSSQNAGTITNALDQITPLWPTLPISPEILTGCTNIVALAGAEQITAALQSGADIIIAGRTTDTATIAALPLMNGDHAGGAWHGAKIGECGALCSTNPTSGVIIIDFDATGFTVQPMAIGAICTPQSVAAHMLYENSDPNILYEPGGHLDVTGAKYQQLDGRCVRVTGSKWVPLGRYTVKLEGARLAGYQSCSLVLLRERHYVENAPEWVNRLTAYLTGEIKSRMGLGASDYTLEFRLIGQNATLGALETNTTTPAEIGVLAIITAPEQASANEIAKLCNPFLLHYPLSDEEPQATFAFPFSPAEWDKGPVHEFCLNHILTLSDPMDAFRLQTDEVKHG